MFPMCWAIAQIAWSMVDGANVLSGGTFDGKSNHAWPLQALLHGVNFLFKCHVKSNAFVIQVRPAQKLRWQLHGADALSSAERSSSSLFTPCALRIRGLCWLATLRVVI